MSDTQRHITTAGFCLILIGGMLLPGCYYGDAVMSVSGRVVDASGNPVPDVRVALAPDAESDVGYPPWTTSTSESGEFSITMTFSPAARKRGFVLRAETDGFEPFEKAFPSERVWESHAFANQIISLQREPIATEHVPKPDARQDDKTRSSQESNGASSD